MSNRRLNAEESRIDEDTLDVITLTAGEWMELGSKSDRYKNPKTDKYAMVDIMVCKHCDQKIPAPIHPRGVSLRDWIPPTGWPNIYRCPRCEKFACVDAGALKRPVSKIDEKTLDVLTLPLEKWLELGGDFGRYRHPESGELVMVSLMTCTHCGEPIPVPKPPVGVNVLTWKRPEGWPGNYKCPRCGEVVGVTPLIQSAQPDP